MTQLSVKSATTALLLTLACLFTGCASKVSTAARAAEPLFIVVRHAEKSNDASRDPSLSEAGTRRALALARRLDDVDLVAAYATPYRRTQQTAQPAAAAHGLTIATYEVGSSPSSSVQAPHDFAALLRRTHARGTVLVVGHSNTVPQIVSQLCGCMAPTIADDAYGDLYDIRFDSSGRPTLSKERY